MRRVTTLLAVAMYAIMLVSLSVGLALALSGVHLPNLSFPPAIGVSAYATVGLVVAVRRPGVPLGWVFLAIGVLTGAGVISDSYTSWALGRGQALTAPGFAVAVWLQSWFWYPTLVLSSAFTLLLFPEGLPSRRWRPLLWLLIVATVAMTLTAMVKPTLAFGHVHVANPFGIRSWHVTSIEDTVPFDVAGPVVMAVLGASVVSLVVRFRAARGTERQRLKWFLLAAALYAACVIATIESTAFGESPAGSALFGITLAGVPVACGLAIFRYRLYDIDRIVSRTVSYAIVTGLLAGVYVGCVALLTDVLPLGGDMGTAASVLVAVALFAPLRRRVQSAVDRRFNRSRYDAERVIEDFSARLRDEVDLDVLRTDLLRVVDRTVAPARSTLWLRGVP